MAKTPPFLALSVMDKGISVSMGWSYGLVLPTKNAPGWSSDKKMSKSNNKRKMICDQR